MLIGFSQRLLALLQFTRMALVFTAVSNSLTGYLLNRQFAVASGQSPVAGWRAIDMLLITLISVGLYGFGMTLNDIIDRRRDSMLAAHRPIPSGRLRLPTAHLICAIMGLLAVVCAGLYARVGSGDWENWAMVMWVGALIAFYDAAGKYLVGPGLIALGLIRMFHCLVAAPQWPCVWHPLILFTHVTLLSAVAYNWEQKRPQMTPIHHATVGLGVLIVDLMCVGVIAEQARPMGLWIRPGLAIVPVLAILFLVLAAFIRHRAAGPREAGQRLMLLGLLWLILYDAALLLTYSGWVWALTILGLLPLSYLMVQLMRWWGRLLLILQTPDYKRAKSGYGPPA